jgi:hypothetical protein
MYMGSQALKQISLVQRRSHHFLLDSHGTPIHPHADKDVNDAAAAFVGRLATTTCTT